MKTKIGEHALISEAKLLDTNFSAMVTSPLVNIRMQVDKISWTLSFSQPIQRIPPWNINKMNKIKADKTCLIPATYSGGMVSTANLIPKNEVPQITAMAIIDKVR